MKATQRGGFGFLFFFIVLLLVLFGYVWFWQSNQPDVDTNFMDKKARVAVRVEFNGLPVSRTWHYELWEKNPNGGEQRIGGIRVREGGTITSLAGEPLTEFLLYEYPSPDSEFILTVEEGNELKDERSERVLMAGSLDRGVADLTVSLPRTEKSQEALLASPTSQNAPADTGVWFQTSLPVLPDGMVYRGWVTTSDGQTLPMGAFRDSSSSGNPSPYDGSGVRKDIPGGDFIQNEPEGVSFPLALSDGRSQVSISIDPDLYEPVPGQLPFLPIVSTRIPFAQKAETVFELEPVSAEDLPTGRVELLKVD